jgi:zinc/manganese transport system substrate-binding protein
VASTVVLAVVLVGAVACAATSGRSSATSTAADATTVPASPVVVATTPVLGALARAVVGGDAEVVVLVAPDADPRAAELTPDQQRALTSARAVVATGLGYEAGMADALAAARVAGIPVREVAPDLSPAPSATDPGGDPRFWLDPDRTAAAGRQLAVWLASTLGLDAGRLAARAEALDDLLGRADEQAQATLVAVPADRRTLATDAGGLVYLAERYGFTLVPTGSPGATATVVAAPPGSQPGPGSLLVDGLGPAGSPAATLDGLLVANASALAATVTRAP